jgi:hypothetical protein
MYRKQIAALLFGRPFAREMVFQTEGVNHQAKNHPNAASCPLAQNADIKFFSHKKCIIAHVGG